MKERPHNETALFFAIFILAALCVLNPVGWAYGFEFPFIRNEIAIRFEFVPIHAKSGYVRCAVRVEVVDPPVENYAMTALVKHASLRGVDDKRNFAAMPSVGWNDEFAEGFSFTILRSFIGDREGKNLSFYAQLNKKGRASTDIDSRPLNDRPAGLASRWIGWPISLDHDPRPFSTGKQVALSYCDGGALCSSIGSLSGFNNLFFRKFTLSVNGAPLPPGIESVERSNNEKPNLNPIYGFSTGVILFISGFLLLGYSAKCFDNLGLKSRGVFWLFFGGGLYVFGGILMFNPHLLWRALTSLPAFACTA
jgi:hypothetical protein